MHLLHDGIVGPLLEAVAARSVVEIGADQGDHTVLLQEHLRGRGGRLTVIETVISEALTERLDHSVTTVLLGTSFEHLPTIEVPDVVLIDGDHNHFTVSGELRRISDQATAEARPAPLILLHDVGWPYGRRDMYYTPERIPAEHRHAHGTGGMRLGSSALHDPPAVGLGYANALQEGGPRNGVLTAVEDFMAAVAGWRLTVVPAIHGLGVLATEQRIANTPPLAAMLDALTGHPVVLGLLGQVEIRRLEALQEVMEEAWDKALAQREVEAMQEQLAHSAEVERARAMLDDRLARSQEHAAALEAQVAEIRASRSYRMASRAAGLASRLRPSR